MKNTWGGLVIALSTLLYCSCASRSQTSPRAHASTSSTDYERQFLENRIHYYQEEAMMGDLCVQKAARPDLRNFCRQGLTDQASKSKMLQDWLSAWYGAGGAAFPASDEHASEFFKNILSGARSKAGAEFEAEFLAALRLHHHHGIDDLTECSSRSSRSELSRYCEQELAAEKKDINQMTAWICDWFRDCLETPLR